MKYLEYRFVNIKSEEVREILLAFLDNLGFSGFIESGSELAACIQGNQVEDTQVEELLKRLQNGREEITYSTTVLPDVNWNEVWEKEFEPVEIGHDIRVRASFHEYDDAYTYDLLIDPKMSFGTGHHETTRMMLRTMLSMDFFNKRVLDMGCGSGVLSILASKMSARYVLAVDIDPWAYSNTLENCSLNGCSIVEARQGGIGCLPRNSTFDTVLANINRNVLLDLMDDFRALIPIGGCLLLSGILESDVASVRDAAERNGFIEKKASTEKNWHCLLYDKVK